jgi:hypothetical protein
VKEVAGHRPGPGGSGRSSQAQKNDGPPRYNIRSIPVIRSIEPPHRAVGRFVPSVVRLAESRAGPAGLAASSIRVPPPGRAPTRNPFTGSGDADERC